LSSILRLFIKIISASDEITHLLHVSKELPPVDVSDNQESSATMDETNDEN
jgi:hypothetical protein